MFRDKTSIMIILNRGTRRELRTAELTWPRKRAEAKLSKMENQNRDAKRKRRRTEGDEKQEGTGMEVRGSGVRKGITKKRKGEEEGIEVDNPVPVIFDESGLNEWDSIFYSDAHKLKPQRKEKVHHSYY